MRFRILALALAALLTIPLAQADDVIAAGATWDTGHYGGVYLNSTQAYAQSFTLNQRTFVDAVSVWLDGNQGYNMWLTDQLGANTTSSNVLASMSGNNVGWQENFLTVGQWLNPGTYFISLYSGQDSTLIWWFGGNVDTGGLGSAGTSDQIAWGTGLNTGFIPASGFYGYSYTLNFLVHDSPNPQVPVETPEPATVLLLASGLTAIAIRRRR